MKREYVIPDFLAAITADALLAGRPVVRADEPGTPLREPQPTSLQRLYRSFRRAAGRADSVPAPLAVQLTFDDRWASGWYARARQRLAAGPRLSGSTGGAPEDRRPSATSAVPARKGS